MKKYLLNLFVATVVACGLSFTSCSSDDPASPLEVDLNKTATISGTILVNANVAEEDAEDIKWSAPASITITASVDYSELNTQATSGSYRVNGTYSSATGKFEIRVPVGANGSIVKVTLLDIPGRLTRWSELPGDDPDDDQTVNVLWTGVPEYATPKLFPDETHVIPTWKRSGDKSAEGTDFEVISEVGDIV